MSLNPRPLTVAELIDALSEYPDYWPVLNGARFPIKGTRIGKVLNANDSAVVLR